MRFHLKEDGTAGVCKAAVGNCPKGDAIHGDSEQEVYSKLEKVMKSQLMPAPSFPEPAPRPTAREIGSNGMMMSYSDPQIIKLQLEAIAKLGLLEKALPSLEAHHPVVAAAWRTENQNVLDYEKLYEEPVEYPYEGADGGHYLTSTKTWVAHTHYELQTVALNDLMDRLESGTLEGADLAAYKIALGDTNVMIGQSKNTVQTNAYLAFNYNPSRQDDDFFNKVKNRFVAEGFGKEEITEGQSRYTMPEFFWKGLNTEAKERVVAQLLAEDYSSVGRKRSFQDKALGRDFGKLLSTTFAYDAELNRRGRPEGETMKFGIGWDLGSVEGSYKLTETGFEWAETQRVYNGAAKYN